MYQDTITLFNRKPGARGQGDTWYPTVMRNVNLTIDRAAIFSQYGAQTQDRAALSIRYTIEDGAIVVNCGVGTKKWVPPKAWNGEDGTITFKSGTEFDFFWLGEWDGGIAADADYEGSFYNHMNSTRDYCFAVTSVAMYSVIPHFEIAGK